MASPKKGAKKRRQKDLRQKTGKLFAWKEGFSAFGLAQLRRLLKNSRLHPDGCVGVDGAASAHGDTGHLVRELAVLPLANRAENLRAACRDRGVNTQVIIRQKRKNNYVLFAAT